MVSIQTNTVLPYCWISLFYQYELLTWKHTDMGRLFTEIEQENSASHCGFTYLHCTVFAWNWRKAASMQQDFNKMRAVSCTIVLCCFPLLVFSLYWCKELPPLKLGSVLVREICSSFGTPSASSSSRGFPAEPCSSALVLLCKTSCQGWDVFPFLLLRFWKFAMKKCHK